MANEQAAAIAKVATMMRDLDICMFTTQTADGALHARPMSNNGEVEFDGDVWFFSAADTRKITEIRAEPRVLLSYADLMQFRFISMSGAATVVHDTEKKKELWIDDLERWFPDGPTSEGVVLIKVTPSVVAYWGGEDEGEITLD